MNKQKELFGHPVALYVLFFTEMWERFSYYGMRAILILFLVAKADEVNPGFGLSHSDAKQIYGLYTFLVYLSSIPGGILADKLLGQKKAVFLGGVLLVIGHSVLAIQAPAAFYTGIAFIIAGVGCLKPNISSMVGSLYPKGDERRDKGFSIFYIGINVGGFLGPLLVGYFGETYGWHYGFGLAGIGMVLGLITFWFSKQYLAGFGESIKSLSAAEKAEQDKPLTAIDRDRIMVMLLAFLMIIVFWGAFEQAGGLMNLYASEKTDRSLLGWTVPASWFQSVNSFFIMMLGVPIAAFWYNWKMKGRESSAILKMALGIFIMGAGFIFMGQASMQYAANGSSAMYWLVLAYLFHTTGELCASPVALSYVTKLAPPKYASIMMGLYFAATGLGNYLASWVGIWSEKQGEKEIFFGITIFCTIFAGLVILFLKQLKKLSHGAEDLLKEQPPMANTDQIEIKPV
ncbi:peptide MFS transporter [Hufsiella ginkgonis]|uniref:MFS transporter n=1 Tax=Hufsiella ginkgonis TaxID=2695274 RepID=A0A7K1XZW2_9SPHI|nr:peptide MFS transporter [Hufsiella ginkgonis]MXV16338.1 MFS transporter [Hufsiella ginkgonis]